MDKIFLDATQQFITAITDGLEKQKYEMRKEIRKEIKAELTGKTVDQLATKAVEISQPLGDGDMKKIWSMLIQRPEEFKHIYPVYYWTTQMFSTNVYAHKYHFCLFDNGYLSIVYERVLGSGIFSEKDILDYNCQFNFRYTHHTVWNCWNKTTKDTLLKFFPGKHNISNCINFPHIEQDELSHDCNKCKCNLSGYDVITKQLVDKLDNFFKRFPSKPGTYTTQLCHTGIHDLLLVHKIIIDHFENSSFEYSKQDEKLLIDLNTKFLNERRELESIRNSIIEERQALDEERKKFAVYKDDIEKKLEKDRADLESLTSIVQKDAIKLIIEQRALQKRYERIQLDAEKEQKLRNSQRMMFEDKMLALELQTKELQTKELQTNLKKMES